MLRWGVALCAASSATLLLPRSAAADDDCSGQSKVFSNLKVKDEDKPDLSGKGMHKDYKGSYRAGKEKDSACVKPEELDKEVQEAVKKKHLAGAEEDTLAQVEVPENAERSRLD